MNDIAKVQDLSTIRRELLRKRQSINHDECQRAGELVLKNILANPFFKDADKNLTIALYSAMGGEIPTLEIFLELKKLGHCVAYPKVQSPKDGLMNFYKVAGIEAFHKGAYGILEPDDDPKHLVKAQSFDVMLIPLVGFDKLGNRLGMGGGFYDRFLKNLKPSCRKIGIAHDFQEIPCIEARSWDIPLDEIITPTRDLLFRK